MTTDVQAILNQIKEIMTFVFDWIKELFADLQPKEEA